MSSNYIAVCMKKGISILLISVFLEGISAQSTKYSTAWFGPNANPVPEFTDASIPTKTTISLMGDYYFGSGDVTKNGYLKVEVPLLPDRVSMKIWTSIFEHYQVTDALSIQRDMSGNTSGNANGDIYVQTRILLLKEKKFQPSIILNSTLKTASGTNFPERRYFDTPGYYFDVEIGKSIHTNCKFISEIRAVVNTGFLCWETTNSTQNDAPMYGGKIIIGNNNWKLENTMAGYNGWMHSNQYYDFDYGDNPLVLSTKLSILKNNMAYFGQYQYGIKDFPYRQIRVGVSFTISKLTPKDP